MPPIPRQEAVRLETAAKQFKKLQNQLEDYSTTRFKLLTQETENSQVYEELDGLEEDALIYKMTGPVLTRQDREEAKQNVSKRLEFIKSEITRSDELMEQLREELRVKAKEVEKYQKHFQSAMQQPTEA